jgi:hypothetical protein
MSEPGAEDRPHPAACRNGYGGCPGFGRNPGGVCFCGLELRSRPGRGSG